MTLTGVLIVTALCLTTIVLAEQVRRYYIRSAEYDYKIKRLDYDELLVADGGEDDYEQ